MSASARPQCSLTLSRSETIQRLVSVAHEPPPASLPQHRSCQRPVPGARLERTLRLVPSLGLGHAHKGAQGCVKVDDGVRRRAVRVADRQCVTNGARERMRRIRDGGAGGCPDDVRLDFVPPKRPVARVRPDESDAVVVRHIHACGRRENNAMSLETRTEERGSARTGASVDDSMPTGVVHAARPPGARVMLRRRVRVLLLTHDEDRGGKHGQRAVLRGRRDPLAPDVLDGHAVPWRNEVEWVLHWVPDGQRRPYIHAAGPYSHVPTLGWPECGRTRLERLARWPVLHRGTRRRAMKKSTKRATKSRTPRSRSCSAQRQPPRGGKA